MKRTDLEHLHEDMMQDPKYRREYESAQRDKEYEARQNLLRDLAKMVDIIGYDRLREIVEAEAEGRCVVLPCKVGDTVYKISYDCARGIRYNPFDEKGYSTAEICLKCNTFPCDLHKAVIPVTAESEEWIWKTKSAFGKTVFLTRAAAEAAKGEQHE